MSGTSLRDFVSRTMEPKRIRFGDLRRLQRDILPARITTREQAEVLIAPDSCVDRADREWRRYLIANVRDFAIWGSLPAGKIDIDRPNGLSPLSAPARGRLGAQLPARSCEKRLTLTMRLCRRSR